MKNLFLYVALFATVLFSSCSKDALDVSVPTTIEGDIPVSLYDGVMTYDSNDIISLINSDTEDYIDELKSVVITRMTYKVLDYYGDPEGLITGTLKADGATLHSVTAVNVKTASDAGTVFEVTDSAALNNAGNNLLNNKMLTIQTMGTANYDVSMGMYFTVHISIDINAVANPL